MEAAVLSARLGISVGKLLRDPDAKKSLA